MVLKYMGMSSSDQIPVHENWCLTLNILRFSNGCIRLGNEMCTLITPIGYIAQLLFV